MKKVLFLTVSLIVLFTSPAKAQWFSDPWYNWYYSRQMMLNQQMFDLQMQQHQITMQAKENARRATEQLSKFWEKAENVADWIENHPYESCPYVSSISSTTRYSCWACKGRGYCGGCDGEGKIKYKYVSSTGEWVYRKCPACKGTKICLGCNE